VTCGGFVSRWSDACDVRKGITPIARACVCVCAREGLIPFCASQASLASRHACLREANAEVKTHMRPTADDGNHAARIVAASPHARRSEKVFSNATIEINIENFKRSFNLDQQESLSTPAMTLLNLMRSSGKNLNHFKSEMSR
jgi:hypothetical protein